MNFIMRRFAFTLFIFSLVTNRVQVSAIKAALIVGIASAFFEFLKYLGGHEDDAIVAEGTGEPDQPEEKSRVAHLKTEQVPDASTRLDGARRK